MRELFRIYDLRLTVVNLVFTAGPVKCKINILAQHKEQKSLLEECLCLIHFVQAMIHG